MNRHRAHRRCPGPRLPGDALETAAPRNNDARASVTRIPSDCRKQESAVRARPDGMVWIPGGEFSMGAQDPPGSARCRRDASHDRLASVHRVFVDGFWMDATEVTNQQFAAFVKATGYVPWPSARRVQRTFPVPRRRICSRFGGLFASQSRRSPANELEWWSYIRARTGVIRPARRAHPREGTMAARSCGI